MAPRRTSPAPAPQSESAAGADNRRHPHVVSDAGVALLKVGQDLANLGLRQAGLESLLEYANKISEIDVAPETLPAILAMVTLAPLPSPIPDDHRGHLETVAAALADRWSAPWGLPHVLQHFVDQDGLALSELEVRAIAMEATRRFRESVDRTQAPPDCATASATCDPSDAGSQGLVPYSPDTGPASALSLTELDTATDDALVAELRAALARGHLAALTAVACIGKLVELRNNARGTQTFIANLTGLAASQVSRYARIYSTMLKPQLSCGTAKLPLLEVDWYIHSLDLSRPLGRTPLELLMEAVSLKQTEPSLSARAWKARLTSLISSDTPSSTESDTRKAQHTPRSASLRGSVSSAAPSITPSSVAQDDAATQLSQLTIEAILAIPATKLIAQLAPSDHLDVARIARELLAKAQSLLELLAVSDPSSPASGR